MPGWTARTTSRFAACGTAGNTATWRPNLRAAGTYEVFVYRIVQPNSDPALTVTLDRGGAVTTSTVNGTSGTTGWVSLGTQTYSAGTGNSVKVTSSGTGCARADAVKFVRR